jgi:hypothetical protein
MGEATQAEMAGSPETRLILDALHATRASARERQEEAERRIREEARKLRQGGAAGACCCPGPPVNVPSSRRAF